MAAFSRNTALNGLKADRNTIDILPAFGKGRHVRVCSLACAVLSALESHPRKSEFSAVEFSELLRRGYRIHLKNRKSDCRWKTDVLFDKKFY